MKKKIISFFMSVAVVLSGISMPVQAEEFDDSEAFALEEEYFGTEMDTAESEDLFEEEEQVGEEIPMEETEVIDESEESIDIEVPVDSETYVDSEAEMFDDFFIGIDEESVAWEHEDIYLGEETETLEASEYPESDHPYADNTDQNWIYSIPGAEALKIHFSSDTQTKSGDYIYIYQGTDTSDILVGKYSETKLAGKDIYVLGENVCIRLNSDVDCDYGGDYGADLNTQYGFSIDSITKCNKEEFYDSIILSGFCGSSLRYELKGNGTFRVYGSGEMYNYDYSAPWRDEYAKNIRNIKIEYGVESIGDYAFRGCSSLTSVEIPNSITSIGEAAFRGCSSLNNVEIPNSVTSIGLSAFRGCSSLKSIVIPKSVTTITHEAFYGCTSLINVIIPDGVTGIGGYAFQGCKSLTSVKIPDSVTSIGGYAFSGCSSLTSIEVPNCVTKIPRGIFSGCVSLTSVKISDNVTSIGDYAFSNCNNLMSIVIPQNVKDIEQGTFFGCSSLKSIVIPKSVTRIWCYAFENCSSLTSVVIPDSVTKIEHHAFSGCSSLSNVVIPDSIKRIESNLFYGCKKLTGVIIPDSVSRIDSSAFENCTSLKEITILSKKYMFIDNYAIGYDYKKSMSIHVKRPGFVIKGYSGTGTEQYAKNNGFTFIPLLFKTPQISKIENAKDGVKISWNAVPDAEKYRVYRKSGSGNWARVADTKAVTYTDRTVSSGTKYTYTLRCLNGAGGISSEYNKTGKSIFYVAAPAAPTVTNVVGGIKVTWKASKGAAKYRVFRKTGNGSWTRLTDSTALTYTDKTVASGKTYSYTVCCLNSVGGYASAVNTNVNAITYVAAPAAPTVTNVVGGIKVNWKSSKGAAKYRVFRKSGNGSWTRLKDTTSLAYTDKTVVSGITYSYTVCCLNSAGGYASAVNTNVNSITYIAAPAISNVANTSSGKITVNWNRIVSANGYEILYRNGITTKNIAISNNATIQTVIGSLEKGKNYILNIRSYKMVNGKKVYSAWSASKNIVIIK